MLTGLQFRLKTDALAIVTGEDGKRTAVTITAGNVVLVLSGPRPNDTRLVDVWWEERTLVMFADDLRVRATQVHPLTRIPRAASATDYAQRSV